MLEAEPMKQERERVADQMRKEDRAALDPGNG